MALMPSWLLYAMGPVTYTIKSLINTTTPLRLLICCYTRLVLKKRKRIGDKGEPYSRPVYSRFRTLEDYLLIWIVTIRSK